MLPKNKGGIYFTYHFFFFNMKSVFVNALTSEVGINSTDCTLCSTYFISETKIQFVCSFCEEVLHDSKMKSNTTLSTSDDLPMIQEKKIEHLYFFSILVSWLFSLFHGISNFVTRLIPS